MNLSLIICTHKRPHAICQLLRSVAQQQVLPDEILVMDGSPDDDTQNAIASEQFNLNLHYFKVEPQDRGLTRQRNAGIAKANPRCDIIAFLDDDIEVMPDYFKQLIETYQLHPNAVGVGGIDVKYNPWKPVLKGKDHASFWHYHFDGWVMKEPLRNRVRKILGLLSPMPPGRIPPYAHGRSSLPPSGKTYAVDHFMGGIASYKRQLFHHLLFSRYFEGYGLYEDMDFTIRASRFGDLYVNTAAQVHHNHDPEGRPNQFNYGQMVVKNGWYVWRLKHPSPGFVNVLKWHLTTLLLANLRLVHVLTTRGQRMQSLTEWAGRMSAWIKLWFSKPTIES